MFYRVNTSRLQYFKYVYVFVYSTGAKFVYMARHKAVGVLVVAAKHYHVGIVVKQTDQSLKIFGGTAFADQYFHAILQLIQSFVGCKAFMVGTNTGGNILL